MHEMSLAVGLMDQIISVAQDNNLTRVNEVELETGVLRQVVPEVMQEAFKSVTEDTIAQDAILKIVEIKAIVECRQCQGAFEPEIDSFLCPKCQKADINVIQGDDIILKAVVSYEDSQGEGEKK